MLDSVVDVALTRVGEECDSCDSREGFRDFVEEVEEMRLLEDTLEAVASPAPKTPDVEEEPGWRNGAVP